MSNHFTESLSIKVCALEAWNSNFSYPDEVTYVLKTSRADSYNKLTANINRNKEIGMVVIQHEFGFYRTQEAAFLEMIRSINRPVVVVFHSVLPHPDEKLKENMSNIAKACNSIIVLTHNSARILAEDYGITDKKISVISHGIHLVLYTDPVLLKEKYKLHGRKVLTTFGLLGRGKSIETTLDAMPAVVAEHPDVLFLVIGKTHPSVVKYEGEIYRKMLRQKVKDLGLTGHVKFINKYLSLNQLLEYLQLTDIYLFTSNDPNQAVSGTFAYAMSCGCPIISTPIPHAKEILSNGTGLFFEFNNSEQLSVSANRLLDDEPLRRKMSINALHEIITTSWENSAISHINVFEQLAGNKLKIHYTIPPIIYDHLNRMTSETGIIQFAQGNQPDFSSGYTLDDNARALVVTCMNFVQTQDITLLEQINKYLAFIRFCQQREGNFLNYVDTNHKFTEQNLHENLNDANGRAIWALGYLVSSGTSMPQEIISTARSVLIKALPNLKSVHSPRSMAFAIKGLYNYLQYEQSEEISEVIKLFSGRLVRMYKKASKGSWKWFENILTYANSVLPESMLYAWLLTGETIYSTIAKTSLEFLLSKTFNEDGIEVISNKQWLEKGRRKGHFGEQPIDVAETIMTLSQFYNSYKDSEYRTRMETAFNWFLGMNRLQQIVYNQRTGGCFDGLEEHHVNVNQGAESTLSYLLARLTIEKHLRIE